MGQSGDFQGVKNTQHYIVMKHVPFQRERNHFQMLIIFEID